MISRTNKESFGHHAHAHPRPHPRPDIPLVVIAFFLQHYLKQLKQSVTEEDALDSGSKKQCSEYGASCRFFNHGHTPAKHKHEFIRLRRNDGQPDLLGHNTKLVHLRRNPAQLHLNHHQSRESASPSSGESRRRMTA